MISEEQKYLADVYKLCGFALMSPLGRFAFILSDIDFNLYNIKLITHLITSILLFIWGVTMIQKGYKEVS